MVKFYALALALLVLSAPAARAQTASAAPTGALTARSYEALLPGSTIAVQAAEDSDQYQRIKAAIEASLRGRGYTVADDAPFVLEFYATEVTGSRVADRSNGGRALQSAVPGADQAPSMGVLSGLNQNLFGGDASRRGSDQGSAAEPSRVHLSMMLSDQRAARRIWQGTASGELRRPDSFAATQSLVPILVNRIGMTVANESFDLP